MEFGIRVIREQNKKKPRNLLEFFSLFNIHIRSVTCVNLFLLSMHFTLTLTTFPGQTTGRRAVISLGLPGLVIRRTGQGGG
jgi:hypothetical protein